MYDTKVITNHRKRRWLYLHDVPEHYSTEMLDEMRDGLCSSEGVPWDTNGFIFYHQCWYHISEFEMLRDTDPLARLGWHGILQTSWSAGVLIRLSELELDCWDRHDWDVVVGRYYLVSTD